MQLHSTIAPEIHKWEYYSVGKQYQVEGALHLQSTSLFLGWFYGGFGKKNTNRR